ncbi:unnamed protein product [Diabrotica balteata]|uniref:Reverse transcriptase domain-containing protein n=1 Tax=Diabrotica balteata TaxID=107213 RepID=A0A9N9SYU3_DIABA|nr:unnamed protein product [Diabrotica balteata]
MSNRTFQVRVNGINLKTKRLQNGYPQGSTLSPTLFLLAINNIAQELPLKANLYADDLIVYTRSSNISLAKKILQAVLHKLEIWSHKSGFTFSSKKTYFIILRKNRTNSKPTLILNDINIKQESTKINLLKILSNRNWGADTTALLYLYKSLIRSQLHYGAMCYSTASKKIFKVLNVIQTALNGPHLFIRRQFTTLRYAVKLYSNINNPNYLLLHTNNIPHKSNTQSRYLTFKELVMNCGYNTNLLTYSLSTYPTEPPWTINTPTINTSLVAYPKNTTNLTLVLGRTVQSTAISSGGCTEALSVKKSAEIAALFSDIKLSQTTDIAHLNPKNFDTASIVSSKNSYNKMYSHSKHSKSSKSSQNGSTKSYTHYSHLQKNQSALYSLKGTTNSSRGINSVRNGSTKNNKASMYSAKNGLYTIQSQSDESRRSSSCEEDKEDEIKDLYYEQLNDEYERLPKRDVKIIMGDCNAKVKKKEPLNTAVSGNYSKHEVINDNGQRLIGFAMEKNMVVRSTQLKRKEIYKGKWVSPDGRTVNQIEHVMIESKYTNII